MQPMSVAGRGLFLSLLCLVAAGNAVTAQTIEIAPFAGYETSGSYPLENVSTVQALRSDRGYTYGTFFDYLITEDVQAEFLWARNPTTYSQQNSDTGQYTRAFNSRIDQYQFGALYLWRESTNSWRPYVAGSFGFTHESNEGGNADRTAFGASLGGGVKLQASRHIGIRGDARWMPTHGSSGAPYTVCSVKYFGNCYLFTTHDYLQRVNFTVGLIIRP